jgi:hypothetical protein
MTRTRMAMLTMLVLPTLLVACTRHLHPTPVLEYADPAPLPLRAALVIGPGERERVDVYGRFGTMGIANTWVSDTGAGLTPALRTMAESVFREVVIVAGAGEAATADVLLVPRVTELRQMDERSGFWVSFQLHAVARDRSGVRLDKTYRAEDEGSTAAAVWGGAFAAAAALTTPTERAMKKALDELRNDLRRVSWVPKEA